MQEFVSLDQKNSILNSFIFCERLSEGKLNSKARLLKLENKDNTYFTRLLTNKGKNAVIVFYVNVVEYEKVLQAIEKKYGLIINSNADLNHGKTYEYMITFNGDLEFLEDKTFFSTPYFILKTGSVQIDTRILDRKKEELNEQIERDYRKCGRDLFKLLTGIQGKNSRLQIYYQVFWSEKGMDSFLRSFFIGDLEAAKQCDNSSLLDRFLGANAPTEKVNLDRTIESGFRSIMDALEPKMFPLGRFPSNPAHAQSLMQQVAINLRAAEADCLLTVNGPPGTGKTTLLKDVFANLVVETSRDIALAAEVCLAPMSEIFVGPRSQSLEVLPKYLLKSNIVLASSNNAAVENVVIDFSKKEAIYEEFTPPNYFSCGEGWGAFSQRGGKSDNLSSLYMLINRMCDELDEMAAEEVNLYTKSAEFNELYDDLAKTRRFTQATWDIEMRLPKILAELSVLKEEFDLFCEMVKDGEERLNRLQNNRPNWFFIKKLLKTKGYLGYINEISSIEASVKEFKTAKMQHDKQIAEREVEVREIKHYNLDSWDGYAKAKKQVSKVKNLAFEAKNESTEKASLWFDEEFRQQQSVLFIKALEVRKAFLYHHKDSLRIASDVLSEPKGYGRDVLMHAWEWINFAIPVISTTFASLANMFYFAGPNSLPALFIDEAGQAVPQACIGGLMRAQQVMAVGDPFQIEPVKTLDEGIVQMLQNSFQVSEKFLGLSSSCQTLLDAAGKYGFQKDEHTWIGIPLWVHRRCSEPMFSISNTVSYNGRMVQGKEGATGIGEWQDVTGRARDKFVEEQADHVKRLISKLIEEGFSKDEIYVITPFTNVHHRLKDRLEGILSDANHQIGTVHTFQGKENKVVILVLGADDKSAGAARWAVHKPNLINVAATRAKERFYVVGDKKLYNSLNEKSIDETIRILDRYASRRTKTTKRTSKNKMEIICLDDIFGYPDLP